MAKINGVELKAIKSFLDHEGMQIHQGNVYIDGKKAGFFTNDSWGGPNTYNFDQSIFSDKIKDFQKGFTDEYKYKEFYDDPDIFIETLLEFNARQKEYKKAVKKGYSNMILVSDGVHMKMLYFCGDPANALVRFAKDIAEMKTGMFKNKEATVVLYTGMKDFNITVDETHPAPGWMYS